MLGQLLGLALVLVSKLLLHPHSLPSQRPLTHSMAVTTHCLLWPQPLLQSLCPLLLLALRNGLHRRLHSRLYLLDRLCPSVQKQQ